MNLSENPKETDVHGHVEQLAHSQPDRYVQQCVPPTNTKKVLMILTWLFNFWFSLWTCPHTLKLHLQHSQVRQVEVCMGSLWINFNLIASCVVESESDFSSHRWLRKWRFSTSVMFLRSICELQGSAAPFLARALIKFVSLRPKAKSLLPRNTKFPIVEILPTYRFEPEEHSNIFFAHHATSASA